MRWAEPGRPRPPFSFGTNDTTKHPGRRTDPIASYAETYAQWAKDPAGFWMAATRYIDWFMPPTVAFGPPSVRDVRTSANGILQGWAIAQ